MTLTPSDLEGYIIGEDVKFNEGVCVTAGTRLTDLFPNGIEAIRDPAGSLEFYAL